MKLELQSKAIELILMGRRTHTHDTHNQRHQFEAKKELDQRKTQNENKLDEITN